MSLSEGPSPKANRRRKPPVLFKRTGSSNLLFYVFLTIVGMIPPNSPTLFSS